ncbi:hypothetical protein AURDEDRAFT_122818 [Auricularia subglabra TFB-10046 SS5]|nr:hypothetical protein AURDEDRAFT_122818 [Auricularia subglabra TFB-10046 SS5]
MQSPVLLYSIPKKTSIQPIGKWKFDIMFLTGQRMVCEAPRYDDSIVYSELPHLVTDVVERRKGTDEECYIEILPMLPRKTGGIVEYVRFDPSDIVLMLPWKVPEYGQTITVDLRVVNEPHRPQLAFVPVVPDVFASRIPEMDPPASAAVASAQTDKQPAAGPSQRAVSGPIQTATHPSGSTQRAVSGPVPGHARRASAPSPATAGSAYSTPQATPRNTQAAQGGDAPPRAPAPAAPRAPAPAAPRAPAQAAAPRVPAQGAAAAPRAQGAAAAPRAPPVTTVPRAAPAAAHGTSSASAPVAGPSHRGGGPSRPIAGPRRVGLRRLVTREVVLPSSDIDEAETGDEEEDEEEEEEEIPSPPRKRKLPKGWILVTDDVVPAAAEPVEQEPAEEGRYKRRRLSKKE